jgi:hypothetical protein
MIPRLSGSNKHSPLSLAPSTKPLPSRTEVQKVFQQFFALMERCEVPEHEPAPETKQSIKRKYKGRKAK